MGLIYVGLVWLPCGNACGERRHLTPNTGCLDCQVLSCAYDGPMMCDSCRDDGYIVTDAARMEARA